MRLAQYNFTSGSSCPGGWESFVGSNGVNYCTVPDMGTPRRASWIIPKSCSYSEVNGYLLADQQGNCDAFLGGDATIDDAFVDGVSITYGGSDGPGPRMHLFTYAIGREELPRQESCQCHGSTSQEPPEFVGWDFMCDSGMRQYTVEATRIGDRVVWTGSGCGEGSSCCHRAGAPWFYRSLTWAVKRQLELTIMQTDSRLDEMVLIREVEIYIR